MHKLKQNTFLAILLLLLIMSTASAIAKSKSRMPPASVEIASAQAIKWQHSINLTGTLSAVQGVAIKSEVAGRITNIYFKSGSFVKAGTPLIQLNPDILKAQVKFYTSELDLAKLQYQRQKKLYTQKATSKSTVDGALAKMQSDAANLAKAEAEFKQTLINAPFSGKIGLRQVSLGDYISAGQTLVNLQQLDPLRVDFSVPETYLSQLTIGAKVNVRTDAFPNQQFNGHVYAMDSLLDPSTRSLNVRALIANKNKQLLPGTFVDVTLALGSDKKVISIPQTAIVYDESGDYVFRVIKGKAVKTPVTILQQQANSTLISKGLKAGDVVITAGQLKVANGAPVHESN